MEWKLKIYFKTFSSEETHIWENHRSWTVTTNDRLWCISHQYNLSDYSRWNAIDDSFTYTVVPKVSSTHIVASENSNVIISLSLPTDIILPGGEIAWRGKISARRLYFVRTLERIFVDCEILHEISQSHSSFCSRISQSKATFRCNQDNKISPKFSLKQNFVHFRRQNPAIYFAFLLHSTTWCDWWIKWLIQTWNPALSSWADTAWPHWREANGTHFAVEFYWDGEPQEGNIIPEVGHAKSWMHDDLVDAIHYSVSMDSVCSYQ